MTSARSTWQGPVEPRPTDYIWYLLMNEQKAASPSLEAVRTAVRREWADAAADRSGTEKFYRWFAQAIEIKIEWQRREPSPMRRMRRRVTQLVLILSIGCRVWRIQRDRLMKLRPALLRNSSDRADSLRVCYARCPLQATRRRLAIYVESAGRHTRRGSCSCEFNDGSLLLSAVHPPGRRAKGHSIAIEGLSATSTDVLVRIESSGWAMQTERLSPTRTSFIVQVTPVMARSRQHICGLGIEHILFGYRSSFIRVGLAILVRTWRRVALTVTAFTVAHSITLAAATLGFVNVPGPPVEATIALSIVLVAVGWFCECRRGEPSLTARWPWLVAFCFGLLHGFGVCRRVG